MRSASSRNSVALLAALYGGSGCSSDSATPVTDASVDGVGASSADDDGTVVSAADARGAASADATVGPTDAESSADGDGASDVGDGGVSGPVDSGGDASNDGATDAPLTCSQATGTWLDPRPWDSCDDTFCQCYGYAPDGGSLQFEGAQNENMGIRSLTLPVPMTPGQPYSLSVSVVDNGFYGDIEIWGSDAVCGAGLEKLYIQPVESKVHCADLVASKPYAYLLFVERLFVDSGAPASEHADTIIACPTVRCAP
jgi:hypothetical protein